MWTLSFSFSPSLCLSRFRVLTCAACVYLLWVCVIFLSHFLVSSFFSFFLSLFVLLSPVKPVCFLSVYLCSWFFLPLALSVFLYSLVSLFSSFLLTLSVFSALLTCGTCLNLCTCFLDCLVLYSDCFSIFSFSPLFFLYIYRCSLSFYLCHLFSWFPCLYCVLSYFSFPVFPFFFIEFISPPLLHHLIRVFLPVSLPVFLYVSSCNSLYFSLFLTRGFVPSLFLSLSSQLISMFYLLVYLYA